MGKKLQILPKEDFLAFVKNLIWWCVFYSKKTAKTTCLGKNWFFSYGLKRFKPIRFQYSFIIIISGRNQSLPHFFLYGDNHQGKVGSEVITFGWVLPVVLLIQSNCMILWLSIFLERVNGHLGVLHGLAMKRRLYVRLILLAGFSQLWLWSYWIAAFFDGQYFRKETGVFEIIIKRRWHLWHRFWFCKPSCPFFLFNQIAGFFDHQYLWKNVYLRFFAWRKLSRVGSIWD